MPATLPSTPSGQTHLDHFAQPGPGGAKASHSCNQELRAERQWSEPEPALRTPRAQPRKVSVTWGSRREKETFLH